jgi:hypothetical protein
MTKITRCKQAGLHYNGFLKIWNESTSVFIAESLIKFFKIICFVCYCGTWVNIVEEKLNIFVKKRIL